MHPLGAPRKIKKVLITIKVTTNFKIFLCTPRDYMSFSRPTAVSRIVVSHESWSGAIRAYWGQE